MPTYQIQVVELQRSAVRKIQGQVLVGVGDVAEEILQSPYIRV